MTLEHLRQLRDDYSDEIPEEIIHEGKFKVRGRWFASIIADLEIGLREGVIGAQHVGVIQSFFDKYLVETHDSQNTFGTERITRDQIEEGNHLLDVVLGRKSK